MQWVQDGAPGVGPRVVTGLQLSITAPNHPAKTAGRVRVHSGACWRHPLVLAWDPSTGAGAGALLGHGCRPVMRTGTLAAWGWLQGPQVHTPHVPWGQGQGLWAVSQSRGARGGLWRLSARQVRAHSLQAHGGDPGRGVKAALAADV